MHCASVARNFGDARLRSRYFSSASVSPDDAAEKVCALPTADDIDRFHARFLAAIDFRRSHAGLSTVFLLDFEV